MTCTEFYEWMANPASMTKSSLLELQQLIEEYPYFHAARILYLKNLAVIHDVRLDKELKKMAVYIPDRRQLYLLINDRPSVSNSPSEMKTPQPVEDKTDMAINVIEQVLPVELPDENDFASTLITEPISPVVATSDYAGWLAQHAEDLPAEDEAGNPLKHQDLIDSFIADSNQLAQRLSHTETKKPSESPEEELASIFDPMEKPSLDDSYFTETLARVYMGQKRYDKALEIIRVLSLKYPKKNSYFADQIRYLEKIINIKK